VWVVIGGSVALAAVLVVVSVPATVRFVASGPPIEFWVMTVLALVVDIPLFAVGPRGEPPVALTLSVCFVFGVFLSWGVGPAIVVQALAAGLTAIGQRRGLRGGSFLVARLVVALAMCEVLVRLAIHRPIMSPLGQLTAHDIVVFMPLAAVWFAVNFGLLFGMGAAAWRGGPSFAVGEIRGGLLSITAVLLLVGPLTTTVSGWSNVLIAIPVVAWTLRSRLEIRHNERSLRDPVTGLLNRQGLTAQLDALFLLDPIQPGQPQRVGIVLVYVETVLAISRRLGRDIYQKIITQTGKRLTEKYGADRVARLPGEGIIVILPGLTEPSALAEATAAAAAVDRLMIVDGIPFHIDVAAGVALSPENGRDLDTLVSRAQLAMGAARAIGQPAQVYLTHEQDVAGRRLAILAEMYAVLRDPRRHGEITVVYQPQVALGTRSLAGAEALVRWTHPAWGPVTPDELIEAIELSEVMHLLTLHMLDRVAAQVRTWNEQGLRLRVAVNVSVQDMHDPEFPREIFNTLDRHKIDPDQLTLEITETVLIDNPQLVADAAKQVRQLGVGLSLDDFGAGHASMQQLQLLPLTEVKLDKNYVSRLTTHAPTRTIVTSIHQLATAMGLSIVAEGVEDEHTAAALNTLPGTIGQGWHFGKPLPADIFTEQWQTR
jgi:diguanylate cyclase (GGDEF)-like protein